MPKADTVETEKGLEQAKQEGLEILASIISREVSEDDS